MGQFPSTHWSLVNRAGAMRAEVNEASDLRGNRGHEAMASLVGRYLPALKIHLLGRHRVAPERVDDILQGFIADEVLEGKLLQNAHASKGKFRSLLLTALDRHVFGELRYDTRQKRFSGKGLSIDEVPEPPDPNAISPETAFDLAWARRVLDQAVGRMEALCREGSRADVWGVFDARILGPLVRQEPPPAYEWMVEQFGIVSATQASNLLVTGKRMFLRTLREVIGEYARTPGEIDAEIHDLQKILARGARS